MHKLPSLHKLSIVAVGTTIKRPRTDELTKSEFDIFIRSLFYDEYESWSGSSVKEHRERMAKAFMEIQRKLTPKQAAEILQAIYDTGNKKSVKWAHDETELLRLVPGKVDVCRPASKEWWLGNDVNDPLKLTREKDGTVIVDLWHARVGLEMELSDGNTIDSPSFARFGEDGSTFFMHSLPYMTAHLDSVRDYVCGEEDGSYPAEIYVKRGRFKFNPLLWFDDTVDDLMKGDYKRKQILTKLIDSHPTAKDMWPIGADNREAWGNALYEGQARTGQQSGPPRLDNNSLDDEKIELATAAGYQGTLSVDISGLEMLLPPAQSKNSWKNIDTLSVVLWDVPGTLVSESPWRRLGECHG
jgi:hypothetical protein|tara:strand:+ start:927 stop:1994 length:1068 start_codon:yes stop_codon:yes gene_type:complete